MGARVGVDAGEAIVTGWTEAVFVAAGMIATAVGFRFGVAARRTPAGKVAATKVSRVLMLAAVAVGSTAAGSIVAERAPGEPSPPAAWILFGAAGIALAGAVGLGFAARTPVQRVTRTRGRALVHSIREEGPGVHGIPVWTIDLEAAAPGVEPFRTEVRAEIPQRMVGAVEEGKHFPIQIERSPRGVEVTLDWVASPHTQEPPDVVPVPLGPPLAEQATQPAVSRYAKVLLPMVIVAALSLLASRWLESAGDAEPTVVPSGVYESTILDPGDASD